jgi:hypothetical protein
LRKTCAGCKKKMWSKGGTVRVPTDENEVGYHDFPICKGCAAEFAAIDRIYDEVEKELKDMSEINVQDTGF